MTWFMAGSAAVSIGTSYLSASSAASSAAKAAGAQSRAEGEAIAKERLNTTVRNAYSTSFAQMQLALQKKQASSQAAGIRAQALAAHGDADVAAASTASIGASVQAVTADIDMRSQAALDMTSDAYEMAMVNYNNDLDMMVLNTEQSAPNVRPVQYTGPSAGQMLGSAVLGGVASFLGSYATRQMSLGLGSPTAASNVASTVNTMNIGYNPSPSLALGNTSSFFNTRF